MGFFFNYVEKDATALELYSAVKFGDWVPVKDDRIIGEPSTIVGVGVPDFYWVDNDGGTERLYESEVLADSDTSNLFRDKHWKYHNVRVRVTTHTVEMFYRAGYIVRSDYLRLTRDPNRPTNTRHELETDADEREDLFDFFGSSLTSLAILAVVAAAIWFVPRSATT